MVTRYTVIDIPFNRATAGLLGNALHADRKVTVMVRWIGAVVAVGHAGYCYLGFSVGHGFVDHQLGTEFRLGPDFRPMLRVVFGNQTAGRANSVFQLNIRRTASKTIARPAFRLQSPVNVDRNVLVTGFNQFDEPIAINRGHGPIKGHKARYVLQNPALEDAIRQVAGALLYISVGLVLVQINGLAGS